MARKKRYSARRRFGRPAFRKFRRRAAQAKPLAGYLGAGLYGALREKVSLKLSEYTNKIPVGNIADEVGMLLVNWAAKKYVGRKVPIVRDIARAGMLIESARIGEAIATGSLGIGSGTTSNGGLITVG